MKTKNYGWVIQNKITANFAGRYEFIFGGECKETCLNKAHVYLTREWARNVRYDSEIVHKVSLTKTGKPKKIIGRG